MNIRNMLLAATLMMGAEAFAQQSITLPAPNQKAKSTSVVEALAKRHSVREYASTPLSLQALSNLCWAACGMSRDDNHRTAPTAMNRQEIRLYAFTTDAVYEYDAKANTLELRVKGDHRDLLASAGGNAGNGRSGFRQEFVMQAPVALLMVIDFEKFGSQDERAKEMTCIDAGIVSENINLYCQSVGLATVPRAIQDRAGLSQLLGLSDKQLPILNNPVGYPKK